MQENEKYIDNQLRNALGDYKETPRNEAWESVRGSIVQARNDRRKKTVLFYRRLLIVALVLLSAATLVVAYRYLLGDDSKEAKPIAIPKSKPLLRINKTANQDFEDKLVGQDEYALSSIEKAETKDPKYTIYNKAVIINDSTRAQKANVELTQEVERLTKSTTVRTSNISLKQDESIDRQQPNEKSAGKILNKNNRLSIAAPPKSISLPNETLSASLHMPSNKTVHNSTDYIDAYIAEASEKINQKSTAVSIEDNNNVPDLQKESINISGEHNYSERADNLNDRIKDTVVLEVEINNNTRSLDITAEPDTTKVRSALLNNISFGVKAGYQSSFAANNSVNKYALAGFIQYNITDNLSVLIQPTYLAGKAKFASIASERVYYNIISTNFDTSSLVSNSNSGLDPDTIYHSYNYHATYDSIRVITSLNDTRLWDVEIPLVFKCKIFKGFSITVGGIGVLSKTLNYTEIRNDYKNQQYDYTENFDPVIVRPGEPIPPAPDRKSLNELYAFTGEPISNYKPIETSNVRNFLRWGYTIGVSAELKKRLLIDISILQMPAYNLNSNTDIKKMYTKPYFRLMVGYRVK